MTTLACVAPELLRDIWPRVSHFIEAAYVATDRVMPDLMPWLDAGKGLLWVVTDGERFLSAAVTSLELHRSGLACRVSACGGEEMPRWLHHLGEIEQYARDEGCVKVWFEGREGWSRALSGYRPRTVSLEKRL